MSDYETAFLIIARKDGTYAATTSLNYEISIDRPATRLDVKRACRELYDKLVVEDIVEALKE